ncbi:MAG: hypothetical protein FJW30_24550 [Acidobacteria bacterium]|nr:hypothetical protein [Acidobacteriota bacterium]
MSARDKYFRYSASGSAFGGVITQPNPLTIPTQAMASLSPSGGYGSSTVENFGVKGLMYIRRATTTVEGDPRQTEVTVTIEGSDFANVVSFDRLVMHLVCCPNPGGAESSITPIGSTIEGLKVMDRYVDLDNKAGVFDAYPTFSALEKAYAEHRLNGLILSPKSLSGVCEASSLCGCESRSGGVRATLYPLDERKLPFPVVNGGMRVEGFGTLYFGSYSITKYARELTMLRLELGCDRSGSGSYGGGSGNGHEEPPG